jgi:hypothetical protein
MSGTVTWSVGYFEKVKLNPKLKLKAGIDHALPGHFHSVTPDRRHGLTLQSP